MKLLPTVLFMAALASPALAQDTAATTNPDESVTIETAPPTRAAQADDDSTVVCRTRPRPASRLSSRHTRICMTNRDWRIVDEEAQDEARRMRQPGAVNRVRPDGY